MGRLAKGGASTDTVEKYKALLQRIDADKPSAADLRELQEVFEQFPNECRDSLGVAATARTHLIHATTSPGVTRKAFEIEVDVLLAQLGRDKADPLEGLLIEQVVSTYLCHSMVEYKYSNGLAKGEQTLIQGNFWEERLTASQKRYMRALDALARYRKLQRYEPDLHLHPAPDVHLHATA